MSYDEQLSQELQDMAQSPGWGHVENYITDQVAARLKDLERSQFADLTKVTRLQGEIAGLRAITIYLQDRIRRGTSMTLYALQKGDL